MPFCNKMPPSIIITVVVLCITASPKATSALHGRVLHHKHGFHALEDVHSAYNSRSKRALDDTYCLAYFKCYDSFIDNVGSSYHSVCLASQKLKACRNVVRKDHPHLLNKCITSKSSLESMTDYWCNKTNGFYLYRSFMKCPFIFYVIPLYTDFSPELSIQDSRASLAATVLTNGYNKWQYNHKYSQPDDPVYNVLSSIMCTWYRWWAHITQITNKYCGGDVSATQWLFITHIDIPHAYDIIGLANWNQSRCTTNMDPLEQVMQITQLQDSIKDQIQPRLGECHPNNVLVRGVSCLVMFYVVSPPFQVIKQLLPSMCNTVNKLKTCWHPVVHSCPGNVTYLISNIIGIQKVVCDIGNDEGAAKAIALWADAFLARKTCQADIQTFSIHICRIDVKCKKLPLDSILGTMRCLMGSLQDMIVQYHENTSTIITHFKQLLSRVEELYNVIAGKMHLSVSVDLIEMDFGGLINHLLIWMRELITFFLVACGFVDYDPVHVPGF